jgi:hypothetical protein
MVTFQQHGDEEIAICNIPIRAAKGAKFRTIDMPPMAAKVLRRYVATGRKILFPRVNYAKFLGKICRDIGYGQIVTLRDLRALNASAVIEDTGNLMVAQQRLGHSSTRTTSKYAKLRPGHELTVATSGNIEKLLSPDMSTVQSSVKSHTEVKKAFSLSGIMERETGFEPATFSLGSLGTRDNIRLFQPMPASNSAEKARFVPVASGHVSGHAPGEYERVLVVCEKCTRESEQDIKGTLACIYCDGPVRMVL